MAGKLFGSASDGGALSDHSMSLGFMSARTASGFVSENRLMASAARRRSGRDGGHMHRLRSVGEFEFPCHQIASAVVDHGECVVFLPFFEFGFSRLRQFDEDLALVVRQN